MFTLVLCLALALSSASPAHGDSGRPQNLFCAVAKQAQSVVERIRGARFSQQVSCVVRSRDEIGAYVRARIDKELGPHELMYEGLALRMIGMLPLDFDYPKGVRDIYESALGGFYDPESKAFSMADWNPPSSQRGVAIHELTHALQDQRFDLDHFVDSKNLSTDQALARMALVEGEATLVALEANEGGADRGEREQSFSDPFAPEYPDAIQQLVQFPYFAGLRLVRALHREGGYESIDQYYATPPRSSEEILHPEKLPPQTPDFDSPPPASVPPEGWTRVHDDSLGEFSVRVLLRSLGCPDREAVESAFGWGGDRTDLFQRDKDPREWLLIWQLRWDSVAAATRFLESYRSGLSRLAKKWVVARTPAQTSEALGHFENWVTLRPGWQIRISLSEGRALAGEARGGLRIEVHLNEEAAFRERPKH